MIGKGAAYSQADGALRALVEASGVPFLATAMGRGVVPDSHPLNVNSARSAALRSADVAIVFGARCGSRVQGLLRGSKDALNGCLFPGFDMDWPKDTAQFGEIVGCHCACTAFAK